MIFYLLGGSSVGFSTHIRDNPRRAAAVSDEPTQDRNDKH
jgi:hypothetical protein